MVCIFAAIVLILSVCAANDHVVCVFAGRVHVVCVFVARLHVFAAKHHVACVCSKSSCCMCLQQ